MSTAAATETRVDPGAPAGGRWPAGERAAPRLEASQVPSITGVRIPPGDAPVRLLNISNTGALVECEHRLKPGTEVTLHFAGTFKPASVRSRVARSNVSGIGSSGSLIYQIGVAFLTPVELPDAPASEPSKQAVATPPAPPQAQEIVAASPIPPPAPAQPPVAPKAKTVVAQPPAAAAPAPVVPPPAPSPQVPLRNRW